MQIVQQESNTRISLRPLRSIRLDTQVRNMEERNVAQ